MKKTVKILIIDIETAPKIAYVWKFFKENISPKQVLSDGYVMSYAAKWLGEDFIFYKDCRDNIEDDTDLIIDINNLLDEADIVVAHYGKKFDLPIIRTRSLILGLRTPSPYKVVDTKEVASKYFRFGSNKLEFLSDVLGVTKKEDHKKYPGFELWRECLKGNVDAWEEMKHYNIYDILSLEDVYVKFIPWIDNHPNVSAMLSDNDEAVCPKCGGNYLQHRGYAYTTAGKFQRFMCNDCGGWGRYRTNLLDRETRKKVTANVI